LPIKCKTAPRLEKRRTKRPIKERLARREGKRGKGGVAEDSEIQKRLADWMLNVSRERGKTTVSEAVLGEPTSRRGEKNRGKNSHPNAKGGREFRGKEKRKEN